MKIHIKILTLLVILTTLMGCVGLEKTGKKNVTFKSVELENLTPSLNQAIMTARVLAKGEQKSLPFVNIDANAMIYNDKIPAVVAKKRDTHIGNYATNPDGIMKLVFTDESRDRLGRIDCRLVDMVYKMQEPDETQKLNISKWLLTEYSSSRKKSNTIPKKDLKNFQKEAGLTSDGLFGPATARSLAKEYPMINVQYFKYKVIYPETPNHMLFILPYKVFMQNQAKLPKGFKSWVEVNKLGLSKERFKKEAKKGERYVLFVYFFDRVDPTIGISTYFSSKEQSRGVSGENKQYYTKPGTWPVIVKSFTIDDILPENLYINIFLNNQPKNTFKTLFKDKNNCIGSHKVL